MVVDFYRLDTYKCGDGCCDLIGDFDELVATREVTDEQLAKLKEDTNRFGRQWTEDFGIEGEDVSFSYFSVRT